MLRTQVIQNCHLLAGSRWEMFLKAGGQPLGTSKRVHESRWDMPKGYCKASEQFLKGLPHELKTG